MPMQGFRDMLEGIASTKAVVRARSLLVRWNVDERIFLLTVLFSVLPEVFGWSRWYSAMGLQFGGLVGVPQPWDEEIGVEVDICSRSRNIYKQEPGKRGYAIISPFEMKHAFSCLV